MTEEKINFNIFDVNMASTSVESLHAIAYALGYKVKIEFIKKERSEDGK